MELVRLPNWFSSSRRSRSDHRPGRFVFYLIAGLAETNRTPFDHVEADSELTGGFTTEYSGMQFALFFLAEYANSIAVRPAGATLFLGGWHGRSRSCHPFGPGCAGHQGEIFFLVFVCGCAVRCRASLRSADAVCVEAHAALGLVSFRRCSPPDQRLPQPAPAGVR